MSAVGRGYVQQLSHIHAEQIAKARERGIQEGIDSVTVGKMVAELMAIIEEKEAEINNLIRSLSDARK